MTEATEMDSYPALGRHLLVPATALVVLAIAFGALAVQPARLPVSDAQTAANAGGREGVEGGDADAGAKGKRATGGVDPAVVAGATGAKVTAPTAPAGGYSPQVRLGFTTGDQWEPAIATDRFGHVYVLYPQYGGVPGCASCLSPTQTLVMSGDHGATWSAPRIMQTNGQQGWDSQIEVDPVDGRTVWAAWLERNKSDIVVARSTDFGATWTKTTVDDTNAGTDKPILAVRGNDVYVAYDHTQTNWVTYTHDAGATWTSVKAQSTAKGTLGWSLAGGGSVTPNGDVFFSWAGYSGSGGAKGPVELYVSSSRDGGATWTDTHLDTSGSPPDCSADLCGWAFLGAQATMTSDDAGTVYALWNAGSTASKGAPERIYFAKSTDRGASWSARSDVSAAPSGAPHAFPAITAAGAGVVRIAWMDGRVGSGLWNVYRRASTNGGATWSAESDISSYVAGYPYILQSGFEFPFGDYFEMSIDEQGTTHAVFGEGQNYDTPGSIWYTRGAP